MKVEGLLQISFKEKESVFSKPSQTMAIVLSSEQDQEAARILQCKNAFEVLKLKPTSFSSNDDIVRAYEALVAPFRKLIRNRLAMQAKARLDDAKLALCDPELRRKELSKYDGELAVGQAERSELNALEVRTRLLEAKCQEVLQAAARNVAAAPGGAAEAA